MKLSNTATVFDVGNDVDISYLASVALLQPPSNATINEQNVSNGINNAILNGDSLPTGFGNLGNLSGPAVLNALNQLTGEVGTGAQTSTFQLMTDFMNLLSDPSSGGGANPTGGGAPGFAPEQDAAATSARFLIRYDLDRPRGLLPTPIVPYGAGRRGVAATFYENFRSIGAAKPPSFA